ncbi:uncharacterized protein LOC128856812 [Anastrepha ludens]|uniref:uncharacterized protein LOC128856812 n=1 Tax=Anastrepha ludens TaxID=28586 RepID=UPI0023AFC241|nr:uncharacterized protein LOC128856812 [Anastrepha ludens]
MKAIIYVLTVHLAFCAYGNLFAASGFYGDIGFDKSYKDYKLKDIDVDDGIGTLAVRPTIKGYKGFKYKDIVVDKGFGPIAIRPAITGYKGFKYKDIVVDKGFGPFAVGPTVYDGVGGYEVLRDNDEQIFEEGHESRHSGHGVSVGHGNHGGFEGQQTVKAIKTVSDEDFDGHGIVRHANQKVKITEVIQDEDGNENPGGLGAHVAHGGHSGYKQHSKQKTIKVIHVDDETVDHGAHTGDDAQQEFETIKIIHTKAGRGTRIGHRDHDSIDGYGKKNDHQVIKTIQVIHNEGGYAGNGFGAHSAHADHFPRDHLGGIQTIKIIQDGDAGYGRHAGFGGRSNGRYGEYDGNGGLQAIKIIKVIHSGEEKSGLGAFRGQSGYERHHGHGHHGY